MTYQFDAQLALGKDGEAKLDAFLSQWFEIVPVGAAEEKRLGIDRRFLHKEHNWPFSVEYKSDARAETSGNAFIETLSSVEHDKPGWAKKSQADMIVHYIPESGEVRFISMSLLRHWMPGWMKEYPYKDIPNDGYTTRGIPVPLRVLDKSVVVGSALVKQNTMEWAMR